MERNKEAIAIQQYDLAKFFDREALLDVQNELYKCQVKGKLYKLIYELNRDTRVTVRTAVGDSDPEEVGEGMAQGSLEGTMASYSNVSKGVENLFE